MADILGLPIPTGYEIIFMLTLVIILVKLVLGIYLAIKVKKSKKEENPVAPVFIGAVMLLMFLWAISRTLFMIFDFFLTKYDTDFYAQHVWWWKSGSLFAAVGVIAILFIIDKKILSNKFKGIFAYLMLAGTILQFVYPVNTYDPDFIVASTIGILGSATSFLVPILFLYIGKKNSRLAENCIYLRFWDHHLRCWQCFRERIAHHDFLQRRIGHESSLLDIDQHEGNRLIDGHLRHDPVPLLMLLYTIVSNSSPDIS
nr:hypothetical protein [Candidatus Sigynarchaeum springense]